MRIMHGSSFFLQLAYDNAPYNMVCMDEYGHDLLFLLNDLGRLLRVATDCRARAYGMTRAQWVILMWLRRAPGLSQKELADYLEVEPITVARLVDRLEARSMLERRPDGRDRRIWRLHLRPEATPLLAEIDRHLNGFLETINEGLSPATRRTVVDALIQMKSNLTAERRTKEVA